MTSGREIPRRLEEIVEPSSTALVVWDMQRGIAARAHNLAVLRRTIPELIGAASDAGTAVVWSRHVAPPIGFTSDVNAWRLMKQQNVATVDAIVPRMQRGTADTEFLDEFAPAPDHLVIEKSTASFFVGTPLDLLLRHRRVRTLVMTGVATELGVEMTARHAMLLGYFVVVVEDAVGSFSDMGHGVGLAYLRAAMPVVPASTIAHTWRSTGGTGAG